MMEFQSTDSFEIKSRGYTVFMVKNPVACRNFDHLKGHTVLMNGIERIVRGVECHPRLTGWREGESIGLAFTED